MTENNIIYWRGLPDTPKAGQFGTRAFSDPVPDSEDCAEAEYLAALPSVAAPSPLSALRDGLNLEDEVSVLRDIALSRCPRERFAMYRSAVDRAGVL